MKQILTLILLLVTLAAPAKIVQEEIHSDKMKRSIPCLIVLPDDYDTRCSYPVVYLLHGYGGNQNTWIRTKPSLNEIATRDSLIFVCPDGESSWYWDSPTQPQSQFETFVARELTAHIDRHYATHACREGRAITGFSMGGHGGLWLSMRHPDIFGAGGSISGGVDIRPFPNNWKMKEQLGSYTGYPERWDAHTVINLLDSLPDKSLHIVIDCGYADFFYTVNQKLHYELLRRNIPHDYYNRPGRHTSDYSANALDYQLLFFNKYFESER